MTSRFIWTCYGTTPDQGLQNIHKWFLMAFKREPNLASADDMTWISERYRNYSEWEYKYRKMIPRQNGLKNKTEVKRNSNYDKSL